MFKLYHYYNKYGKNVKTRGNDCVHDWYMIALDVSINNTWYVKNKRKMCTFYTFCILDVSSKIKMSNITYRSVDNNQQLTEKK